ncbi:MAG TPA: hypothetical protein VN203_06025, partial [Candidatus Acidoferrum sp.]|nr:hypothetical protein [Candidatus Acidoferrum sp.]
MWVVSMVGQSPRELREGAAGFAVSPDGTHIALGSTAGPSGLVNELWVMGSEDKNPQKVLSLEEKENRHEWIAAVSWSPDGQRLSYIRIQEGTPEKNSLETCDLKVANRTVVVPDSDLVLRGSCWLRDGRMIYSRQDAVDSNKCNLWQVGMDTLTGMATGKPKRLMNSAGSKLVALSGSTDGMLLTLEKLTQPAQVYLGELAAGGMRMSPPRRLTNDELVNLPLAWTPDSKAVLFESNRNDTWGIFKQGISQEAAEAVVTGPADL